MEVIALGKRVVAAGWPVPGGSIFHAERGNGRRGAADRLEKPLLPPRTPVPPLLSIFLTSLFLSFSLPLSSSWSSTLLLQATRDYCVQVPGDAEPGILSSNQ